MLCIIFLEGILKVRGRTVIKLTLALTNTCSSCNSNEAKACWGEAFQLRRSQLAWLDGFQQLFRWKEANQDRSLLWLFAERVGGYSRIPFQVKGSKQTEDTVLSDHDNWRMIKTLFLIQRGGGVHPASWSYWYWNLLYASPVYEALFSLLADYWPNSVVLFFLWDLSTMRLVAVKIFMVWLGIVWFMPVSGWFHSPLPTNTY